MHVCVVSGSRLGGRFDSDLICICILIDADATKQIITFNISAISQLLYLLTQHRFRFIGRIFSWPNLSKVFICLFVFVPIVHVKNNCREEDQREQGAFFLVYNTVNVLEQTKAKKCYFVNFKKKIVEVTNAVR